MEAAFRPDTKLTPRGSRANSLLRAAAWSVGGLDELFPHYCRDELAAAEASGWQVDSATDYCGRCGASCHATARTDAGCPFCVGQWVAWRRVVRLGIYGEPLGRWVRDMKFSRRWVWGDVLGAQLGQVIEPSDPKANVVVCPVPMHFLRRCWRGYNQAQLIADALARVRGWPVAPLLRRTKRTRPQTLIAPSRRTDNIRGSFAAARVKLTGWHVWLVDDVKTSGATLNACARLLLKTGAASVSVAVVAVADPKGRDFKAT